MFIALYALFKIFFNIISTVTRHDYHNYVRVYTHNTMHIRKYLRVFEYFRELYVRIRKETKVKQNTRSLVQLR